MFGIGIPEIILIAIVALVVVGPKNLPLALRAIGRGIGEFRRAMGQLRKEVGYDDVVDEVTRPLREGMAGLKEDVLKVGDDPIHGSTPEYPEGGPDDYGALPETVGDPYPDVSSPYAKNADPLGAKGANAGAGAGADAPRGADSDGDREETVSRAERPPPVDAGKH